MREIETQINTLKEKDLEKFTRPCEMFMTFKSEEGK
jgi:hypothetical protein